MHLNTCLMNLPLCKHRYAMLWPIFLFFLIVFLIFALLFLVASLSGADFCVSPDEIVQSYLTSLEKRADTGSIEKQAYDFGLYYIVSFIFHHYFPLVLSYPITYPIIRAVKVNTHQTYLRLQK